MYSSLTKFTLQPKFLLLLLPGVEEGEVFFCFSW